MTEIIKRYHFLKYLCEKNNICLSCKYILHQAVLPNIEGNDDEILASRQQIFNLKLIFPGQHYTSNYGKASPLTVKAQSNQAVYRAVTLKQRTRSGEWGIVYDFELINIEKLPGIIHFCARFSSGEDSGGSNYRRNGDTSGSRAFSDSFSGSAPRLQH